jgi:hypothetical protein
MVLRISHQDQAIPVSAGAGMGINVVNIARRGSNTTIEPAKRPLRASLRPKKIVSHVKQFTRARNDGEVVRAAFG